MNRYEYVALTNPQGASKMVQVYNLKPDRHPRLLAKQMAFCVEKDGPRATDIFAQIHPDKDLFNTKIEKIKADFDKELNESKSKLEMFSNMNGQAIKSEIEQLKNFDGQSKNNRSELLIIGGIILISLALVLKK